MKYILSSLAALALIAGTSTKSYAMNCVAYARQVTGMNLSGDAWHWWYSADGVYQRGHQPVPGAVMVFSRTRHMIHGHVAVVRSVLNSRHVLIDQANWWTGRSRGVITEAVSAIDVSPRNDWTAVEVQYGRTNDYGRVNPISGFVYASHHNNGGMVQDAVLREPADSEGDFQNVSFTVPSGHRHGNHRSVRHHTVFRHAAIRVNCAHGSHKAGHTTPRHAGTPHQTSADGHAVVHAAAHTRSVHVVAVKAHRTSPAKGPVTQTASIGKTSNHHTAKTHQVN